MLTSSRLIIVGAGEDPLSGMKNAVYRLQVHGWLALVLATLAWFGGPVTGAAEDDRDAPATRIDGGGDGVDSATDATAEGRGRGMGKGKGKGRGRGSRGMEQDPQGAPGAKDGEGVAPSREDTAPRESHDAGDAFVIITGVNGNAVSFTDDGGGGGRGRGFGGGRGGRSASETTLEVAPNARITTATVAPRTREFRVGIELGGGIENDLFNDLDGGRKARIVTDGDRITEINVIVEDTTMAEPIAVRPKRPPSKQEVPQ